MSAEGLISTKNGIQLACIAGLWDWSRSLLTNTHVNWKIPEPHLQTGSWSCTWISGGISGMEKKDVQYILMKMKLI